MIDGEDMDAGAEIVQPTESDWPAILAVLESANLHRIGGPEIRKFPLSDCFIARESGKVVGVSG